MLSEQREHYEQIIASLEEQLVDTKQYEEMEKEARRWQTMYEELQAKVGPFQVW